MIVKERSSFHAECKNGEMERMMRWGGIPNIQHSTETASIYYSAPPLSLLPCSSVLHHLNSLHLYDCSRYRFREPDILPSIQQYINNMFIMKKIFQHVFRFFSS
jgi:hypothetical protein